MIALVAPAEDRYEAWRDCMADFGDAHDELHGTGHWFLPEGLHFDTDPDSFAALVALLRRIRRETPEGVPVPSDFLWIFDEEEMVGFIRIAHRLDARMLEHSGHIGYSIRPSRRREGHAGRALALALDRSRELGIDRVRALNHCSNPPRRNADFGRQLRDGKLGWFEEFADQQLSRMLVVEPVRVSSDSR